MSTTPAEKIENSRDNRDGRIGVCAPAANHSREGEEVHCFAVGGGT
jgi:hypothetical protein